MARTRDIDIEPAEPAGHDAAPAHRVPASERPLRPGPRASRVARKPVKILFVAANVPGADRMAIEDEYRALQQVIVEAGQREAFQLIPVLAARRSDLEQALQEHRPEVVHFACHGSQQAELVLRADEAGPGRLGAGPLASLFRVLRDNLRLVVFNACYAGQQAEEIRKSSGLAIGMRARIEDRAAIEFARSLYRALANGRSVREAFDLGVAAIEAVDPRQVGLPQLFAEDGHDADHVSLVGGHEVVLEIPWRDVGLELSWQGAKWARSSVRISPEDGRLDAIMRREDGPRPAPALAVTSSRLCEKAAALRLDSGPVAARTRDGVAVWYATICVLSSGIWTRKITARCAGVKRPVRRYLVTRTGTYLASACWLALAACAYARLTPSIPGWIVAALGAGACVWSMFGLRLPAAVSETPLEDTTIIWERAAAIVVVAVTAMLVIPRPSSTPVARSIEASKTPPAERERGDGSGGSGGGSATIPPPTGKGSGATTPDPRAPRERIPEGSKVRHGTDAPGYSGPCRLLTNGSAERGGSNEQCPAIAKPAQAEKARKNGAAQTPRLDCKEVYQCE